jgi:hypothetical protein
LIALFQYAVQDHGDDTVAKLAVNRLTVVPSPVHPVFQTAPRATQLVRLSAVIANYITMSVAVKSFFSEREAF